MAQDPIALIIQGARQRGLDPQAVLAVASREGLGGGIGDQGTSFGPWQLHRGGALPRGVRNPQQWAWSPAGISYALDRIAGVARGLRGPRAVSAIVSRFERPANAAAEIQGALGAYGHVGRAGRSLAGLNAVQQPPLPGARPGLDVSGIVNFTNEIVGLPPISLGITSAPPPRAVAPRAGGLGNVKPPRRSGPTVRFIEHIAAPFGLEITSTTGGRHVKGSYHYKGRAVDFAGDPARMAALQHFALKHPGSFREVFYTGPGAAPYFVKDGEVRPLSELDASVASGHRTHVHVAA